VRSNGAPVGRVTSGGYGYTLDASIAYAYLPAELVEPGTRVSVGIFGRDVGAVVMREPLFDPKNEKVKA
jgi:4-methylaminobutanoate oxidase (formaldehyde-forming)